MPKRIQRRRTKGWRMPKGAVVVSRPSKWGNPYRLSDYRIGYQIGEVVKKRQREADQREMAVRDFEMWLEVTPEGMAMAEAAQRELRGKTLACWCKVGKPCHGDVLLRIANE